MKTSSIAKARQAKGLSVERAAVAFGTTSSTWRKYENHPELMSIEMGERMSDFLGIPFDSLVPSRRSVVK